MFGFLFGVLCLFALYHFLKRDGVFRHGFGFRHGGFCRRFALRRLFARLDTSPGQERTIEGALSDFGDECHKLRQDKHALHEALAAAMREDSVEAAQLTSLLSQHEGAFAKLQDAGIKAFTQVHDALDPYQRRRLAELLTSNMGHHCGRRGWA